VRRLDDADAAADPEVAGHPAIEVARIAGDPQAIALLPCERERASISALSPSANRSAIASVARRVTGRSRTRANAARSDGEVAERDARAPAGERRATVEAELGAPAGTISRSTSIAAGSSRGSSARANGRPSERRHRGDERRTAARIIPSARASSYTRAGGMCR